MNNVRVLLKPCHAVSQCIDQGLFLKMTSVRQLVFTRVLGINSSHGPITALPLSDEAIKYAQNPKQTPKFSKPGSQYDRAVVGWALAMHLATHPWSFGATSEYSTVSGSSQLRMDVDSQERCAASRAFGSTSLWGSYCSRRGSCLFIDEFNSIELI